MTRNIWKLALIFVMATFTLTLYGQQGGGTGGQNLKVLPNDIPRQRLMGYMQAFNRALGVRCDHCHVDDKAKDEKPEKEVARAMLKMVMNLHENAKDFLPDGRDQKLNCWTCHRGSAKIEMPAPPSPPQNNGQKPPQ